MPDGGDKERGYRGPVSQMAEDNRRRAERAARWEKMTPEERAAERSALVRRLTVKPEPKPAKLEFKPRLPYKDD